MPQNPNDPKLQRTEPAIPETPVSPEPDAEADLGHNAESEIAEIISNPETVKAVLEFLAEESLDWSDCTFTEGMWGWAEGSDIAHVEVGDRDYFVSPDSDTTYRMAFALVLNDLREETGVFNPDFIQSHININHLRDMLRPDVEEMAREDARETGENAEDEDAIEKQVENQLQDPIQYLQDIYGNEEGLKQAVQIAGINYEEAAEDAVAADGEGHFLSTYDGLVHDLPSSGGQWWRHN